MRSSESAAGSHLRLQTRGCNGVNGFFAKNVASTSGHLGTGRRPAVGRTAPAIAARHRRASMGNRLCSRGGWSSVGTCIADVCVRPGEDGDRCDVNDDEDCAHDHICVNDWGTGLGFGVCRKTCDHTNETDTCGDGRYCYNNWDWGSVRDYCAVL